MDNEKLYDSLDEEYASTSSLPIQEIEQKDSLLLHGDSHLISDERLLNNHQDEDSASSLEGRCIVMSSREIQENLDISSIVPLYSGDKYKSEIGSSKKSSIPRLSNNRNRNNPSSKDDDFERNDKSSTSKRRSKYTRGSCSNIDSIVQSTSTKSYLSMFQSRIGCSGGSKRNESEDTSRALFGDTERSLMSDAQSCNEEYLDAEDNHSDTTSYYMNHIEDDRIKSMPYTEDTSYKNLRSTTEVLLTSRSDKVSSRRKSCVKHTPFTPIPILGGLGPDREAIQEKMERRRKQLLYGQKASNRNRIRMVEMNVLKNLKNEMHNSNLIEGNKKALQT